MTTLNVNTITPAGNTLTLGASGDTVVVADDVKVNTVKDAGGNTLWVSDGSGNLSSVHGDLGGAMKLISTQTVTNQASVSFTSGIDSTYKEYVFKFIYINAATSGAEFTFQMGSGTFDTTMTTTIFRALNKENGTDSNLEYQGSFDQAQGTAYQTLQYNCGSGADEITVGELHVFNPASTTYVKHYYSTTSCYGSVTNEYNSYCGGYFNTTSVLTQIDFKMNSGNLDGKIKMYGISS